MAVVGFMRNGQTVAGFNLLGLALNLIFIIAVIVIVAAMSSPKKVGAPLSARS